MLLALPTSTITFSDVSAICAASVSSGSASSVALSSAALWEQFGAAGGAVLHLHFPSFRCTRTRLAQEAGALVRRLGLQPLVQRGRNARPCSRRWKQLCAQTQALVTSA